jgi:competence protein ComEC
MKSSLMILFFSLCLFRLGCFFFFGTHVIDGQSLVFTTHILNEPQQTNGTTSFRVMYANVFGGIPIRVITKPNNQLRYAEKLKISGSVSAKVLDKGSIVYSLLNPEITELGSPEDIVIRFVVVIRKTIRNSFQFFLDANSASLLMGIVLGVSGEFSQTFVKALRTTGVMHIVAASGMNVSMVAGFFFPVFSRCMKRQLALVCVGILIAWYVILSGMQPSIIRAAIMIGLSLAAQIMGRQYDGIYALFLAAGGMLLISPELLFDVGFQLSVASTLGIVTIKPLFPSQILLDDVTTTLAAQLATLPIMLSAFGQYSVISVLVNFLVLWTIPFLMMCGAVAVVCALVVPFVAPVFLYLAAPLLWYMVTIITFFSQSVSPMQAREIPWSLVVGYYLCLMAIIIIFQKKQLVGSLGSSISR